MRTDRGNTTRDPRKNLLRIYQAALDRVEGRRAVREQWSPSPDDSSWAAIAIGKAAGSMMEGAMDRLGERLASGLVITKPGHEPLGLASRIEVMIGGHPMPNAKSLAAGERLVEYLAAVPPGMPLLALISGGASALAERLQPGLTLEDLARANQWLLGSGLAIGEINRVRKALSAIKDGGLWQWIGERPVTALLLSDVRGDDPRDIGSGLLFADPRPLPSGLPVWLETLVRACATERAPSTSRFGGLPQYCRHSSHSPPPRRQRGRPESRGGDAVPGPGSWPSMARTTEYLNSVGFATPLAHPRRAFAEEGNSSPPPSPPHRTHFHWRIIACLDDAKAAAARKGAKLGYHVHRHDAFVEGCTALAGGEIAAYLKSAPRGLHLWGGEPTVRLPENPGRGGRAQHLALAAAMELAGSGNICLLAAGTDGTDGPGEDAGALVDGATLNRALSDPFAARQALERADSGSLLAEAGDLIETGPSGTNVMDLFIGIVT